MQDRLLFADKHMRAVPESSGVVEQNLMPHMKSSDAKGPTCADYIRLPTDKHT